MYTLYELTHPFVLSIDAPLHPIGPCGPEGWKNRAGSWTGSEDGMNIAGEEKP